MADKHRKKCSTLPTIRKIKLTLPWDFNCPSNSGNHQENKEHQTLARTHTKGNIYTLWWKYEMVLTTTKISGSSKKHNRLILRPSIPPLSIYQRTPNEHMKETHISFIGLVTITVMETTQVSIREMDKEDVVHRHNGIYCSHKEERNCVCRKMGLDRILLN